MSFFDDKVILITGGTGSFGKKFIQALFKEHKPAKVIIYSRNQLKQHEMRRQVSIRLISAISPVTSGIGFIWNVPSIARKSSRRLSAARLMTER